MTKGCAVIRFSLDSVSNAAGMADDKPVKVIASVIAVGVMMFAAKSVGAFADVHPIIRMLAFF